MRMRHGDRQRIGRVRLDRPLEAEQYTDHVLYLCFIAAAAADHGLLHLSGGVFVHRNAAVDHRADGRAAGLPKL